MTDPPTVVFLLRIERDKRGRIERTYREETPNFYKPGANREETIQALQREGFQELHSILREPCALEVVHVVGHSQDFHRGPATREDNAEALHTAGFGRYDGTP